MSRSAARAALVLGALGGAAAAGAAGAAALRRATDDILDPGKNRGRFDVDVVRAGGGEVALSRTAASGRPGTYGLVWPDGSAVIGDIVNPDAGSGGTVTRRLLDGAVPPAGSRARVDAAVWLTDVERQVGVALAEMKVPGEVGPMPAWYVDGDRDTWVILVHGHGMDRREGLRAVPALRELGLPQLLISWRNDGVAPATGDGLYHLGATEWRDLEAAVRFAYDRRASGVVLYGFSMGAAISLAFLRRSSLAGSVRAIVLDAPVLDWRVAAGHGARSKGRPAWLGRLAIHAAARRVGANLRALAEGRRKQGPGVPTLVFHGSDDPIVPITSARSWSKRHRDVSLVEVAGAGHVGSWNLDPGRYAAALAGFLIETLALPTSAGATAPARGPAALLDPSAREYPVTQQPESGPSPAAKRRAAEQEVSGPAPTGDEANRRTSTGPEHQIVVIDPLPPGRE